MKRSYKTHWRPARGKAMCGINPRCYAEYWPEYVDCLVCMYHLGRYVPLSKLREHQLKQGKPTHPHDPKSCICEPHEGPYHAERCTTCYPKSVEREGSDDWALALDGSKIYIEREWNGLTIKVQEWPKL